MEDTARNTRRERVGVVTSDNMNKSIVVVVKRKVKHPIYGKFVNKSSKFMAHDEENTANTGDTVKISETRPMSKSKAGLVINSETISMIFSIAIMVACRVPDRRLVRRHHPSDTIDDRKRPPAAR